MDALRTRLHDFVCLSWRLVRRRGLRDARSSGASRAGAARAPRGPPVTCLPPEVLTLIVAFYQRGDLRSLARAAASSRALRGFCEVHLWRAFACRQCSLPLFHWRSRRKGAPVLPAVFDDGPTLAFSASRHMNSSGRSVEARVVDCFEVVDVEFSSSMASSELTLVRHLQKAESVVRFGKASGGLTQELLNWCTRTKMQRLFCPCCHLYLGESIQSRQETFLAGREDAGEDLELPHAIAFLCGSYLCAVDKEGRFEEPSTEMLHCNGAHRQRGTGLCGQPLCSQRDVLSRAHCWTLPQGPLEVAWYVNGFIAGSVSTGPARRSRLAQGNMEVADVSCSNCLGVIGWCFASDLSTWQVNRNQVGRFGLCTSAISEVTSGRLGGFHDQGDSDYQPTEGTDEAEAVATEDDEEDSETSAEV